MQKIEVTGAFDLASLFLYQECFCIAYQYFLWDVSVTLYNNAYLVFEPLQVMSCNQRAEIKQLMCNIVACIATTQDNVEMDWLVYEIKLGTSIVSLSTVYCKCDLNMCIYNIVFL